MQNNISNTTFSSRINFVRCSDLQRKVKVLRVSGLIQEFNEGHPNGMAHRKINQKQICYTGQIMYCLGGLLKIGSDDLMFHLHSPTTLEYFPIIKTFAKGISPDKPLKGLLIGGLRNKKKSLDIPQQESVDLLSKLKQTFKEFKNNDFSIFFGQIKDTKRRTDCGRSNVLYDAAKDTYDIAIDFDRNAMFADRPITPENVKNYFKFIHVSPNDEVFVDGQKTQNSFWNFKEKTP